MRVAIVGCGYVGLELGSQLTNAGHTVTGIRRSEEGLSTIREAGLNANGADVTRPSTLESVPDVDAVVFSASSGGGDVAAAKRVYVDGLRGAIEHFGARKNPPDRIVYTSSTGVYGNHDGAWVDETTERRPETPKTQVLAEAEDIALDLPKRFEMTGTVARLAGIYGPDRYRVNRYVDSSVTEGWLNLVHRDDAAGAITFLLESNLGRGDVVLVVDDEPVEKSRLAYWLATEMGHDPPEIQTVEERLSDGDPPNGRRARIKAQKRCSNAKLRGLGFEFAYPTFREGYSEAIS